MNYLAHLLLGGPSEAALVGSLLGDFVRGPVAAWPGPAAEREAIALHRRIDAFTDRHPDFRASCQRIEPARRRVAGVLVDLYYDHFLALHWSDYADEPLAVFCARAYAALERNQARLPPRLARMVPSLVAEDWLGAYREPQAIARTLQGMARRLRRPELLAGGEADLLRDGPAFEADFRRFFPQALSLAAALTGHCPAPAVRAER